MAKRKLVVTFWPCLSPDEWAVIEQACRSLMAAGFADLNVELMPARDAGSILVTLPSSRSPQVCALVTRMLAKLLNAEMGRPFVLVDPAVMRN